MQPSPLHSYWLLNVQGQQYAVITKQRQQLQCAAAEVSAAKQRSAWERSSCLQQLTMVQQKMQYHALEVASKSRQLTELDAKRHKVAQVLVLNLSCICA